MSWPGIAAELRFLRAFAQELQDAYMTALAATQTNAPQTSMKTLRRGASTQAAFYNRLERPHVGSAETLRAHLFGVRNALTFAQVVEGRPFDTGHVEEDVLSPLSSNESKSFVGNPLDRAF